MKRMHWATTVSINVNVSVRGLIIRIIMKTFSQLAAWNFNYSYLQKHLANQSWNSVLTLYSEV